MMNRSTQTTLLLLFSLAFLSAGCQSGDRSSAETAPVPVDTLDASDFETVIASESALMARPVMMAFQDDERFAIYDQAVQQVLVFNTEGEKRLEFGGKGEGPGEWTSAGDLDYRDGLYFMNNRDRFLFDLFDDQGAYLRSVSYPGYLRYAHKQLLEDQRLLVATDGREDALAMVMDLKQDGEIIRRIGEPEGEAAPAFNLENERNTYANGEIPESALNSAFVFQTGEGYLFMMNALGELRHYSEEGEMLMQQKLPSEILDPIFQYTVNRNKEARPHSVAPLEYVVNMQVTNGRIYLLTNKGGPAEQGLEYHFLVYDLQGNLQRHLLLPGGNMESFYYGFQVSPENRLYFIDVMQASIVRMRETI